MIQKALGKINKDRNFKELLSGSLITFVLKLFGMLLGYMVIYLISKKNGAEGVGVYSLFRQAIMVCSIVLGLGINISILRFVGQFNNDEERHNYHFLVRYILKLVGPGTIIVGLVMILFAGDIAEFFGRPAAYKEFILALGIALPFFTFNQIAIEFLRGLKQLRTSEFVRSVVRPLIMVIVLFVFLDHQFSNYEILYLFMAGTIVAWLFSGFSMFARLKRIAKAPVTNFSQKELIKTSAPMMVTSVSSAVLVAIPFFFIDFFVSAEDVGTFTVPFQLAQLITIVLVVVNTIAAPKFSELYWSKQLPELKKLIRQSSKIMFWAALILSLILIFSGKWILQFFGEEFVSGQRILIYLVIGQFVNVASGSVGVLMNMTGRQRALQVILLTTVVAACIALGILVPLFGAEGGALAFMSAVIFQNIVCVVYMWRTSQFITVYVPFLSSKNAG